jgi:hypothetical protein
MKYFHYLISDNEIKKADGEIQSVPADFIEYKITLSGESVYYKLKNEKLAEIIGEAMHEDAAKRRVEEFVSGFNVSLV